MARAISPDLEARLRVEGARLANLNIPLYPRSPLEWRGMIPGKGRWKGQLFHVAFLIPPSYPNEPPLVRFVQIPRNHPNIHESGYVCLSTLQGAWSPESNLATVWDELQWLLENPNNEQVMPDHIRVRRVRGFPPPLGIRRWWD